MRLPSPRQTRFLIVPLLLLPGVLVGQGGPPRDALATVQAFWDAALSWRWKEAVSLLHLPDVDSLRRQRLEGVRMMAQVRARTVEDIMRQDPYMPREAAVYELDREERMRRQYGRSEIHGFFGLDSASQLERLTLEELAVRWLQASDPLWVMQELHRVNGCPLPPQTDSLKQSRKPRLFGAVPAGADTAYVLFEMFWLPVPRGVRIEIPPRIAPLIRTEAGWRIRPLDRFTLGGGGSLYGFAGCPTRPSPEPAATDASWRDPSPHEVKHVVVRPGMGLEVLDWGGTGQSLVFLAGFGNSAHVFDGFAPTFCDRYRGLGITRPGLSASTAAPADYDNATLAQDIVAALDSLRLVRPYLVAHSSGGAELNTIGVHHPQAARALIYLDGGFDFAELYADSAWVKTPIPRLPLPSAYEGSPGAVAAWMSEMTGPGYPESEVRSGAEHSKQAAGSPLFPADSLGVLLMRGCSRFRAGGTTSFSPIPTKCQSRSGSSPGRSR